MSSGEEDKPTPTESNTEMETGTEPSADDAPRRRVRRSQHIDAPELPPEEAPAASEASEAPAPKPDEQPRRPERPPPPRRDAPPRREPPVRRDPSERRAPPPRRDPAERRDPAQRREPPPRRQPRAFHREGPADAVGAGHKRTIYRQDTHDVEAPQSPAPASKPAAQSDKITLLLHPAPKAAPLRKKKESRPLTPKEALKARLAKHGKPAKSEESTAPVELQEAWFEATGDEAIEAIEAAGRSSGEALVKAWLDRGNTDALSRAADALSGRVRKAAKRALSVLRARGVAIPEAVEETSIEERAPEGPVASFVPPDASGTSFFSISQRQPGGRFFVCDVLIRPEVGVVHASSGKIAGKHIRRWKNRVTERFGAAPVEVPLDWARYRIAEGRKLNARSGQLLPLGFDSCAALFEPTPAKEPAHPVSDLEPSDADVTKAAGDSDVLHNEPEFRTWVPDRRAVDELLAKVGERVGSEEGEREPGKVDEALRAEIAAATDRYFAPERRELLAALMHDSAISVRRRGGDEPARRVLAVARAVRQAGLITSPPSEVPFLLSFFRKAVAILVQRGQGRLEVPVPHDHEHP